MKKYKYRNGATLMDVMLVGVLVAVLSGSLLARHNIQTKKNEGISDALNAELFRQEIQELHPTSTEIKPLIYPMTESSRIKRDETLDLGFTSIDDTTIQNSIKNFFKNSINKSKKPVTVEKHEEKIILKLEITNRDSCFFFSSQIQKSNWGKITYNRNQQYLINDIKAENITKACKKSNLIELEFCMNTKTFTCN